MKTHLHLHCLAYLLLFLASGYAQPAELPWELSHNEDGLLIYTRPQNGGEMLETKAVIVVLGNIDSAYALIGDPRKFAATDPYSTHLKVIKTVDPTDLYYYQTTSMPFYLKDRDMVMRMRRRTTSGGYFITIEAVSDILPPADGFIRDTGMQIYISLRRLSAETFEMTYKASMRQSDMPANTANKAIMTSTHQRLSNLRDLVTPQVVAKD